MVAFGNGANDVITGVIAAGTGTSSSGIFFAVGSLCGAWVYVTVLVSALVVLFSPI